jgi:hypothetical protein
MLPPTMLSDKATHGLVLVYPNYVVPDLTAVLCRICVVTFFFPVESKQHKLFIETSMTDSLQYLFNVNRLKHAKRKTKF